MATFNEFCANVKKGFSKLGNQVEKVADTASLRIKLTAIDGKLAEYYTELGKLTYTNLRGTLTEDEQKRMETLLTMIDGKIAEKKQVEDDLARMQNASESEKTEYEATAEAPAEPEKPAEPTAPAEPAELTESTETPSAE